MLKAFKLEVKQAHPGIFVNLGNSKIFTRYFRQPHFQATFMCGKLVVPYPFMLLGDISKIVATHSAIIHRTKRWKMSQAQLYLYFSLKNHERSFPVIAKLYMSTERTLTSQ